MESADYFELRKQLNERRDRLDVLGARVGRLPEVVRLISQVDAALERMDGGTYGLCETCHEAIEPERLSADPLVRFCLDHLSSEQQRALEQDLVMAAQIQATLLPTNHLRAHGWEVSYYYEPAGPVGGDYCDAVSSDRDGAGLYFVLGDVSGKGVAASMLVSHLHAAFHSLVSFGLAVDQVTVKANRLLCESSLASHYATLVCGRADARGELEICNAGHFPPLLIGREQVRAVDVTGVPAGMFCDTTYGITRLSAKRGDTLLLYTDGLCEARRDDQEYGLERVRRLAATRHALPCKELIASFVADLRDFLGGAAHTDDLTLLALQYTG
jgi:sigma-B regulation protein RsbU (phosphoserine phosphatase)